MEEVSKVGVTDVIGVDVAMVFGAEVVEAIMKGRENWWMKGRVLLKMLLT